MTALEKIRTSVVNRYRQDPHIHIDVSVSRPKVSLQNRPATITAVYPHVFRIEETDGTAVRAYTLQYADLLTKKIRIAEIPV